MKFFEKVSTKYWQIIVLLTLSTWYLTFIKTIHAETKINLTVLFQPPPEESQPEETEGAASRQNRVCSQDIASSKKKSLINLTAIVPDNNYGLTVAKRPTFWVYIPATSAKQVILTLKEKGKNPHWQQSTNLEKTPGVIGIKLLDEAPVLEVGKEYQWAAILVCGNQPHPNDPVVTAKIKRIPRSQIINNNFFDNYTALEKAAIYAQKGIWYDPLTMIIAEKSSLSDWDNLWINYLQSAGLDKISREPFIELVNSDNY